MSPNDLRALGMLGQTYERQQQIPATLQKVKEYVSRQPKSAPGQEFLC